MVECSSRVRSHPVVGEYVQPHDGGDVYRVVSVLHVPGSTQLEAEVWGRRVDHAKIMREAQAGWTSIAAALRQNAWRPGAALVLLGLHPAITK